MRQWKRSAFRRRILKTIFKLKRHPRLWISPPLFDRATLPSRPNSCIVVRGGCAALHSFQLKLKQRRSAMKVKEMMHKGVDWVAPDTPVTELAKLMKAHDIGCIPVGEDDRLIGMV